MNNPRDWHVLLIGGASGVGKTSIAYPLARHFGIGITQIDDFQVILERMTAPERYPDVHLFRTRPEAFFAMDEDAKLAHAIAYATAMAEALEYVVANHLAGEPPIVLEGDFLLPALAARPSFDGIAAAGRVRALFVVEPDEDQIANNYAAREGDHQPVRARASWRYSEWLRAEASRRHLPVLEARPWDTAFERALALLSGPEAADDGEGPGDDHQLPPPARG